MWVDFCVIFIRFASSLILFLQKHLPSLKVQKILLEKCRYVMERNLHVDDGNDEFGANFTAGRKISKKCAKFKDFLSQI